MFSNFNGYHTHGLHVLYLCHYHWNERVFQYLIQLHCGCSLNLTCDHKCGEDWIWSFFPWITWSCYKRFYWKIVENNVQPCHAGPNNLQFALLLTCDEIPYSIFQSSIMPLSLHTKLFFMCWITRQFYRFSPTLL
jgi:hypothetical protein